MSTNRAVSRSLTDSGLSLFLFKTRWGALPGYGDPGCMRGREESVAVVAADREEGEREEKGEEERTLARGAQSGAV